jgi:hypothetical protein
VYDRFDEALWARHQALLLQRRGGGNTSGGGDDGAYEPDVHQPLLVVLARRA